MASEMNSAALSSTVEGNSSPVLRRSLRVKRVLHDINSVDNARGNLLSQEDKFKTRKKRMRRPVNGPVLTFDSLCDDVINVIYMMFDSPRDLYNIAFCSKRLLSIVSYEHVLRSAIFQQKNPAKTAMTIFEAVQQSSIYVPSISRLLRLVNGRRCERGSLCWGFDMIERSSSQVNFARPGIGLYLCRKCIGGMTIPFQRDTIWATEEDKVAATILDYSMRGLSQLCTEVATVQPVGPIITMIDLKQISHTYRKLDYNEERYKTLSRITEEREKRDTNISKKIELLDAFHGAKEDLAAYKKKRTDELSTKIKAQNAKRLCKLRSMHGILSELLQDHKWKDLVLECTWDEGGVCFNDANVLYPCAIVYEAMRRMINAPSLASRKKIKKAAKEIRDNFDIISESDFFSYSFLGEDDKFQEPLRGYCTSNLNPKRFFSKFPRINPDYFMSLLRKGKLLEAFFLVIHEHDDVLKEAFALSVEFPVTTDHAARNFSSLATSVWEDQTKARRNPWSPRSKAELELQVDACKRIYSQLKANIIDYMESTETQRFLGTPNDQVNRRSRLDAIETIYTKREYDPCLRVRNFPALLIFHRQLYLSNLAN
eukprot:CAMPEP_0198250756 /NCGR_PEP_ID=MMETSP1447-20131203/1811_1 /TAXON_ID=420782 /ORGANISM="Chaetoceros dichaeta, Strain CCMP1751" /LENGTH=597 /DNA_ID=CAMNT_0043935625 /DNA_START=56 /DNA_END=1849 /DNA_ORIENTATION=+